MENIILNKPRILNKYIPVYCNNIAFYNNWKEPKEIISYEEIILHPNKELNCIRCFFGFSERRIDLLLENLDEHKKAVFDLKTQKELFNINTRQKGSVNVDVFKFRNMLSSQATEALRIIFCKHKITNE